MDFNSLIFIGFLAGAAVLYYTLPRLARPYFLLLASYAFYCYQPQNRFMVWMLGAATLATWLAGLLMEHTERVWLRRVLLVLGIAVPFGLLFCYKYGDFALAGLLGHPLNLVAPLGLSYFSFQAVGYLADVYRKDAPPQKNPLLYALYVSFFPCIFTGPIERYGHLSEQLFHPVPFEYDRVAGGAFRVLWGYCKKMVIADNLSVFVGTVCARPQGTDGAYIMAAILLFGVQLYMDFSGCCDIAIGGARLFGIELLENFDHPFAARSFRDLWKRWHMSLSSWLRDYVYIPLGGSHCARWRSYLNLLITFALCGLWHGAAMGYLLWGVACGVLIMLGRITLPVRKKIEERNPLARCAPLQKLWQRAWVCFMFVVCLVFFAGALYGPGAMALYTGVFSGWQPTLAGFAALGLDARVAAITAVGGLLVCLVEWSGPVHDWVRRLDWWVRWPLYYFLAFSLLVFGAFGQSAFIYQQY